MNECTSSLTLEGIYRVSWLLPGRYPRELQPIHQLFKTWREGKTGFIWETVCLATLEALRKAVGSKPLERKAYEDLEGRTAV